jgi:hypothetical protein
MKLIYLGLLTLVVLYLPIQANGLTINCNLQGGSMVSIVLHTETPVSELVMDNSVVKGSARLGEHIYSFVYPPTKNRYEIRLSINRFTGDLLWEHGRSPFGVFSDRNVHRKGLCDVRQRRNY